MIRRGGPVGREASEIAQIVMAITAAWDRCVYSHRTFTNEMEPV
jgi:hypothetical protein